MNETITPSQYFDQLKTAKNQITNEALKESYSVFIALGEKYSKTGQSESIKKLCFLADTLIKEEKLIELGITTYVYKDTVEDYIDNVADKCVKIVELSRYMREIPDELVETIEKTKDIFSEFYVIFTDYTGKETRKIEKERRDKDPILFGVFKNNTSISDRFYFLGDWVDEFCDLTLDKMVEQYKTKLGKSPVVETKIPQTSEELISILQSYNKKDGKTEVPIFEVGNSMSVSQFKNEPTEKPKGFFSKIRSVFSKK